MNPTFSKKFVLNALGLLLSDAVWILIVVLSHLLLTGGSIVNIRWLQYSK